MGEGAGGGRGAEGKTKEQRRSRYIDECDV